MKLGQRGKALIKSFERCELTAYHGAADPAGLYTIGWGHTGPDVHKGLVITAARAEQLFAKDLKWVEHCLNDVIPGTTKAQNDAMGSLCYNIGRGGFSRSSVLKRHNEGDPFAACKAFLMWHKLAGQNRRGLMRRRCQEAVLYCEDRW